MVNRAGDKCDWLHDLSVSPEKRPLTLSYTPSRFWT